ncbi:SDR family NAD(P)-dependent oxidoreductase [Neisseria subflava]|uniref:SDR family NAD(P)-dependent oxidoreductase n=1 Tax=Neisseria subflava TaxID=28449 RepID=UPI002543F6E9|nr:SDR family NAD(P)-dependent oxidoreductase [Neisseria subflava]
MRNITSFEHLYDLKGHILVVLGGSYGIGKDIIDIAQKFGLKTYALSRSSGVNVADPESIKNGLEEIYKKEHRIDFVVNTAAILTHKALSSMSQEEIAESISVNYIGAVNVAAIAYPYLKDTHGSLLNFASSSYNSWSTIL